MKKHRISSLFYNNKFVAVFSLIAAVFIWALVTLEKTPQTTVVLKDVPVTIDYKGLENKLGLTAFGEKDFTVNVTVRGQRFVVDSSNIKDKITVTANTGSVVAPGVYSLRIDAQPNDNSAITIDSLSDNNISVYFDYLAQEEFDIEPEITGLDGNIPDGYTAGEPFIADTSKVKVSGPESEVHKIKGIVARAALTAPVTETQNLTAAVSGISNDTVDYKYISILKGSSQAQLTEAAVTLPVYKIVNISTAVAFTGKPAGFSGVEYTVSPANIQVGVPESRVNSISSFVVKRMDFTEINAGTSKFTVPASKAETNGVVILDGTEEFTVTVTARDVTSRITAAPETLAYINAPRGADIQSVVPDFAEVAIVGPAEQAEAVTFDETNFSADLSTIDPEKPGTYTVPVTFTDENCWIYGEYTATVTVR
ncbi:MAG: hypothetical protein IKR90_05170 [Clostridia bacterium]|nr:hypothetical protein [Clostridia bacterium]